MFLSLYCWTSCKPLEFVSKCQCFKGQHAGVQKKRKRRGDFLQDTWPGNLVQLHPARHPQTFINFFRSNCQPFHARSYLPWRSGFQRLSLQSSAVNFLKLFTFRIFTGVDRKSSALRAAFLVALSSSDKLLRFFLFARWSYHHAWMPAVFPRCFDGIYTSMMKRNLRNFTTEIASSEFSNKYPGEDLDIAEEERTP